MRSEISLMEFQEELRAIIGIPILILIMLWLLSQKGKAVRKTCGDAISKGWRSDE